MNPLIYLLVWFAAHPAVPFSSIAAQTFRTTGSYSPLLTCILVIYNSVFYYYIEFPNASIEGKLFFKSSGTVLVI